MLRAHWRLLILTTAVAGCGEGLTGSPTGSIEITSVTVGEPSDSDGYTIAVDAHQEPLGANAIITVPGIAFGDHQVELLGIAHNCDLAGDNPRTVTINAEAPLRLTLAVSCAAGRGSITVHTRTTGPNPDPDGYSVRLDAGTAQPANLNSVLTFPAVPTGDHILSLSGTAANCAVTGASSRTVTVAAGAESAETFTVACRSTASGTLLMTSDRTGKLHVYRIEPDGTGLLDLTPDADGAVPDWSPDGTWIAFASNREGEPGVYLMGADGSSPVRLADGGTPVWSPDGSRIAYSTPDGVTVMTADGSDPVVLTPGYAPAWSPDGSTIAFTRPGQCAADICGVDLYLMDADGSAIRKLTSNSNPFDRWLYPSWSPDGTLIAFTRQCCLFGGNQSGVGTIEPSGGLPSRVYGGAAQGKPVWSPDGSTLVFAAQQEDGTTELMLMPSRGAPAAVLASSPGSEYPGSWR
jgi:Tol biopolymer transport system component